LEFFGAGGRKSLKRNRESLYFTGQLVMSLRTPFMVSFAVFLVFGAVLPIAIPSHAASSTTSGYWLKNTVNFNLYGQFVVNETLYQTSSAASGISSVTFGFPINYRGHIAAMSSSAISGSSTSQTSVSESVSNNTFLLTESVQPALQTGLIGSVKLGFYVLDSYHVLNGSNYNAPIVFNPSVNLPMDNVVSEIVLPYTTERIVNTTIMSNFGFSHTVGANTTLETWNFNETNVSSSLRWGEVNVYATPASSGSVQFSNFNRQIAVDSTGTVTVTDTINIHNSGLNTFSTLDYAPLTNASTLSLLPNTDPPLSNVGSATITSDQLDLASTAVSQAVEGNSSETITLQYPLGQQYWNYSNGVYHVDVPAASPISALIGQYTISSVASSGVVFTSSHPTLTGTNTTTLGGNLQLTYRMGIGSGFGAALPVAGVMFIAVFAAAVIFRPKKEESEDVGIFDAMVKDLEDKVSGTNDILSELKTKKLAVVRNDLTLARTRIEEFRQKSYSRLSTMRSQLPALTSSVQTQLNEVFANDREFDRVVREILNNYDQFISRKMKEDTFLRVQQSSERRMQQATNTLLDSVHDLREEYESES
jgi:hypothetical protein